MKTHVDYCCTTWGSWKPRGNKVILQRMQAICNKFFRLTFNLERTASVRNIIANESILNVNQTYDFYLSQLMHKARACMLPDPLQSSFEIGIFRPCMFRVKPARIAITEKSICQSAPRTWNSLPQSVTKEHDFQIFKRELKKHILEN